jgi:hypothetical protein
MSWLSFLSDDGQEHFLDRTKLFVKEALPIEKALPVHDGEVRFPSESVRSDNGEALPLAPGAERKPVASFVPWTWVGLILVIVERSKGIACRVTPDGDKCANELMIKARLAFVPPCNRNAEKARACICPCGISNRVSDPRLQ